jgi:catechol 2,3-dioxygenase-like lactoylglutathione lyase family enzyme
MEEHRPIQGLGEIALRVRDLETMTSFYRDIVGLEFMDAGDGWVFFRIADGVEGHTQVVGLFGPGREPYGAEGRSGSSRGSRQARSIISRSQSRKMTWRRRKSGSNASA